MTRKAFTLVELLVALGVTSILVVLMLNVFMSGSTLWQKNEEKLDTFREARAAMQMMTRDFSGLSAIPDLPDQFPILALQPHPSGDAADRVNQEIYGIVPIHNSGRTGLCAVGYFCVWDEAKKAFLLKRQFTESDTTFDNLQSALSQTPPPMDASEAFKTLFARPDPKIGNTTKNRIDDIATYVYGFQIQWAKTSPQAGQPPVQQPWPQNFARELPAWVEIRFKALGSNAARKLGAGVTRETWTPNPPTAAYQNLILPGEQEFVTRIKLSR